MQVRFILAVVSGELVVSNRKRKDVEAELEKEGYDRMPKKDGQKKAAREGNDNDEEDAAEPATGSYEYLLSMAISSLTEEKVPMLHRLTLLHLFVRFSVKCQAVNVGERT